LIIMLIAGLIAAIVSLWQSNERFREFFTKMWEGIRDFISGIVGRIREVFDGLSDRFGFVIDNIRERIEAFKKIIRGIIDFIAGVFTGDWERAWEGVRNIFAGIVQGLAAMFKLPINAIIKGINTFIRGLNRISIPDWVPGVGGRGINIPEIPMLAKGSNFSPDTFIAGEEGPELITNAKGSKVFTATETANVFNKLKALNDWKSAGVAQDRNEKGVFDTQYKKDTRSLLQCIKDLRLSLTSKPGKAYPPQPYNQGSYVDSVYKVLRDIANMLYVPDKGAIDAYYHSTTNNHITINQDINNEFHGDRAGQERSAEAMDRASEDATGELARALAYVR